jgi:hypothetical protein
LKIANTYANAGTDGPDDSSRISAQARDSMIPSGFRTR